MKMAIFCDVALCSLIEATDVSQVLTAYITRAMNASSQKTVIFILAAVRT
jgi:hypothetical protein